MTKVIEKCGIELPNQLRKATHSKEVQIEKIISKSSLKDLLVNWVKNLYK